MRGYFSNIARHSGLSFTGQGGAGRAAGETHPDSLDPIASIERNESIMISALSDTPRAGSQRIPVEKRSSGPTSASKKRGAGRSAEKEAAIGEQVSATTQTSAAPPIREEIVMISPEEPKVVNRDKESADTRSLRPPTNYFTRTTEIVAGDEVEPEEVQTIVLRELQEWVAAGAADDIDELAELRQGAVDLEPGVVRIGERHRPTAKSETVESTIEENRFELSIGTINVTVEDENLVRPIPAPRRDEGQAVHDDGRRFARLKRSFL